MAQQLEFRLMTYNIGGGRKGPGSGLGDVIDTIEEISPDILVVQETTEFQDADGEWHSDLDHIAPAGDFGKHVRFEPTLSMQEHMHLRKTLFIDGIFCDWQEWKQGNGILSRWEFVRLGTPSKPGVPKSVPLYQTPFYQGDRDTEPRHALLARLNRPPAFPFVVGVHLTTLVGERGQDALQERTKTAQKLRTEQVKRLLDLLRERVLKPGELVFLMGDLNATVDEPCISAGLEKEGGFVRLAPSNDTSTMPQEVSGAIDHIYVYPGDRLVDYDCWIVDSPIAQEASDHLPVVADVRVI